MKCESEEKSQEGKHRQEWEQDEDPRWQFSFRKSLSSFLFNVQRWLQPTALFKEKVGDGGGELHCNEMVAFALLTQQPRVRFSALTEIISENLSEKK